MALTEIGRRYLRRCALPEGIAIIPGVPLTRDLLVDSLRCFLVNERWERVAPETLGPAESRLRGLPHLPEGGAWPQPSYLFAQLDLATVAAFDLWSGFPKAGTMYIYIDPSRRDFDPYSPTAGNVVITSAPPQTLAARPPATELPHAGMYSYPRSFLDTTTRLSLRPGFAIDFVEHVPGSIIAGLERELGVPMLDPTDALIGGDPLAYQSEDARELFAPSDWDWMAGPPDISKRFLLLQGELGDGQAHVWVDRDELARGAPERVEVTYSGT